MPFFGKYLFVPKHGCQAPQMIFLNSSETTSGITSLPTFPEKKDMTSVTSNDLRNNFLKEEDNTTIKF